MLTQKGGSSSRRTFLTLCIGALGAREASASYPSKLSGPSSIYIPANPVAQNAAGPEVSLNGKLKGGLMGVGGETTGYALMEPRLASGNVEVDMSGIKDAGRLDGKEILVTGVFQTREYVERGKVLVFKAKSVRTSPS